MDQVGLDLTRNMQPPKSVRIQVKVKEDFGELMTESGVMKLQRNNILFMRRDEVEPLIHQGVLEHVQASVQ
jgi:GINS complex subunit 1